MKRPIFGKLYQIAYEQNSCILYSSDLMQSPGDGRDTVEECGYLPRAESISPVRIPNEKGLEIPNGSSHPYPRGSWRWAMGSVSSTQTLCEQLDDVL